MYTVEMYVRSPIFQGQLIEKNITDNFNSLGAKGGLKKCQKRVEKNAIKGSKNEKLFVCFKKISQCAV